MGRASRPTTVRVNSTVPPAETRTMRSRKGSHDAVPSDDGALEKWLHDLVDGVTTARRLRQRLDAAGERHEGDCAVCEGWATGKKYFGVDGHLHGRLSA